MSDSLPPGKQPLSNPTEEQGLEQGEPEKPTTGSQEVSQLPLQEILSASKSEGSPAPLRILSSQQLLCGARSVVISHGGEQYRLLVTKNGKLMLQK